MIWNVHFCCLWEPSAVYLLVGIVDLGQVDADGPSAALLEVGRRWRDLHLEAMIVSPAGPEPPAPPRYRVLHLGADWGIPDEGEVSAEDPYGHLLDVYKSTRPLWVATTPQAPGTPGGSFEELTK